MSRPGVIPRIYGHSDAIDVATQPLPAGGVTVRKQFAAAYADQNKRDYNSLVGAVASGRITAERDL